MGLLTCVRCGCSMTAEKKKGRYVYYRCRDTTAPRQYLHARRATCRPVGLQGIWTDGYATPLERPARYAGREFLTEAEIAAQDKERAERIGVSARGRLSEAKEKADSVRGTEADVNGAYNHEIFSSTLPTGRRTSLVVDPADGRIPPYTPEALKAQRHATRV